MPSLWMNSGLLLTLLFPLSVNLSQARRKSDLFRLGFVLLFLCAALVLRPKSRREASLGNCAVSTALLLLLYSRNILSFRVEFIPSNLAFALKSFLFGPLLEEILYREFLLESTGVLSGSLYFALCHWLADRLSVDSLRGCLHQFLFGVLIRAIYHNCPSLALVTAIHGFCNLFGAPDLKFI